LIHSCQPFGFQKVGTLMARAWRDPVLGRGKDVPDFDGYELEKYGYIFIDPTWLMALVRTHNLLLRGASLREHQVSNEYLLETLHELFYTTSNPSGRLCYLLLILRPP
jgi:hypothetical protein